MSNLEEFKQFIKTIPGIRQEVLEGHYTWQQLYESYVLYGKDDKVFEPYLHESKQKDPIDLSKIMYIIKNIDLEAVERSLDGLQKVLNIVIKMTDKDLGNESFYKDQHL